MTLFEITITVLIPLGIIIWGICVYFQKGTWLLAGWNTLSKEKGCIINSVGEDFTNTIFIPQKDISLIQCNC